MGNGGPNLDDLRQQLTAKCEEVKRILAAINTIEELFGQPKTSLDTLSVDVFSGVTPTDSSTKVQVGKSRNTDIRPDEFLGIKPLDAAKKYLKRIGQAAHIDDIANAVSRGSAAIKGPNWKDELEESLIRSTREVVKAQEHFFGLTEFYTDEQLKGLREARRQRLEPKVSKRRMGRTGWKVVSKKDTQQTEEKGKEETE